MKRPKACAEADFLKAVATHQMRIVRDDGVHRHIEFRRPGTRIFWFDLITWPGTLCIDGDCGTYVFRRLQDMFEFFRTEPGERGPALHINPSYWAEKCVSTDRRGTEEYSRAMFADAVNERLNDWLGEVDPQEWPPERVSLLRSRVHDEVLAMDETEQSAHEAAADFEADGFRLTDFWETNLRDHTFGFIWCLYAIAHGIRAYDDSKTAVPA